MPEYMFSIRLDAEQLKEQFGFEVTHRDWMTIQEDLKNSLYEGGFWDTLKQVLEQYFEEKED